MTPVTNTAQWPWPAIVFIVSTFPDGYKEWGTGSVVGTNDVLTATHVVNLPGHGGWATNVEFLFGAGQAPTMPP